MKIKCKNGNTVESWYDRATKSYVTRILGRYGNRIGDAEFSGCKESRDSDVKSAVEQNGGKA